MYTSVFGYKTREIILGMKQIPLKLKKRRRNPRRGDLTTFRGRKKHQRVDKGLFYLYNSVLSFLNEKRELVYFP